METTYRVVRSSSVDLSQNEPVAEFASRNEALAYIREHSVDENGNVSEELDCDYLRVEGEDA